ncbi:MAG: hypothetical protein RL095_677 [Verrucomicrobiota bacterium]
MIVVKILFGLIFAGGAFLWLTRRKDSAAPLARFGLLLMAFSTLVLGVSSWMPEKAPDYRLQNAVLATQWQYPLDRLGAQIGSGSIAIVVAAEGQPGSRLAEGLVSPAGCTLTSYRAPATGINAAWLRSLLQQKPKGLIFTLPLPREAEELEELCAVLEEHAGKPTVLSFMPDRADAANLFNHHLLWAHVESKGPIDITSLNSHSSPEELFGAGFRLVRENDSPAAQSAALGNPSQAPGETDL